MRKREIKDKLRKQIITDNEILNTLEIVIDASYAFDNINDFRNYLKGIYNIEIDYMNSAKNVVKSL